MYHTSFAKAPRSGTIRPAVWRPTWLLAYLRIRGRGTYVMMLTSFRKVRRGVREGARVPPHLRPRLRVDHAAGDDGGGWPGERVRG